MSKSSLEEIVAKQLSSYPKTRKRLRMAYYEAKPLAQIHADTMFWNVVRAKGEAQIPILVIVDVATRYTRFFLQARKNDSVRDHVKTFLTEVAERFHASDVSGKTVLVTDGAKELAIKGLRDVRHKVSTGLNKAVLAEVAIRQARVVLREWELEIDLENLANGTEKRIDRENLPEILAEIETKINAKARVREPREEPQESPQEFQLGDPVLALNLHKFFPFQIGVALRKTSYDRPWYTEPFYVSRVVLFRGLYKYWIRSYLDNQQVKYSFYPDQLQALDPTIASEYIHKYLDFVKTREGTDFF